MFIKIIILNNISKEEWKRKCNNLHLFCVRHFVVFTWTVFFVTPWTAACQASLSITNSWSLLKLMSKKKNQKHLMSIELVMPSNHLVLCCLLLPHLQSFPASRSFQWISSSQQVAKLLAKVFSFSMSPSSEYSGLIPFRMDWLDFLVDQGTLKSLLQHHSSKASILWRSAFFMVQLYSHTHTWLLEKP